MKPFPQTFFDLAVIEEVSLETWRLLFDAIGWPSQLFGIEQSFVHDDLLSAFAADASDDLLHALEVIHSLGTDAGRDAITDAMRDRRVDMNALPANLGPRDYAIYLFVRQRTDASLADVFARAQTQMQERGEHRRYTEFAGRSTSALSRLSAIQVGLEAEIRAFCLYHDLGDHVEVRLLDDGGLYVFSILRSDRTRNPLAVVHGRSTRATLQYRPVHNDIIRYDSFTGRLRIAARVASMIDFYRDCFGRVLFDDDGFFAGDAVCTLATLQQKGRSALEDHGTLGVGRVALAECIWERGDRQVLQIRAPDCFRQIEELRLPLAEGRLIQAKLRMEIIGVSTRPVMVNVRVPNRVEISQKRHEALVDEFLSRVGIRSNPRSEAIATLWSLYPWRHPVDVWRALFGIATDSFVASRVLTPTYLDSVPDHHAPGAGNVLEVFPVSQGEYYGVSKEPEITSRSLSATDINALQLDPERFRLILAERFVCSSGVPYREGDSVLDLGIKDFGGQQIRVAYAIRPPVSGTGTHLRNASSGDPCALLIPSTSWDGADVPHVCLESPIPSFRGIARRIVEACGVLERVPAVFIAPDNARLVVDTRFAKIWFDGIEISSIQPNSQPYRFVVAVASTPRVDSRRLAKELTNRDDGNHAARVAKNDAKRAIENALTKAGFQLDADPFPPAGTGFYRCSVVSYVV